MAFDPSSDTNAIRSVQTGYHCASDEYVSSPNVCTLD